MAEAFIYTMGTTELTLTLGASTCQLHLAWSMHDQSPWAVLDKNFYGGG